MREKENYNVIENCVGVDDDNMKERESGGGEIIGR
jgi:hypothetical protein